MKTSVLWLLGSALLVALPDPSRAQEGDAARRVAELFEQAGRAKTEGRPDEAEKLHAEGLRLQAEAGGQRKKDRKAGKKERGAENGKRQQLQERDARGGHESGAEGTAQLDHVRQAIRHLRAAGLREPAEGLEKHARALEQELFRAQPPRDAHARGDDRSAHELAELRQQVQKLAHQLEQLRAEAKHAHGEGAEKK